MICSVTVVSKHPTQNVTCHTGESTQSSLEERKTLGW